MITITFTKPEALLLVLCLEIAIDVLSKDAHSKASPAMAEAADLLRHRLADMAGIEVRDLLP